MHRRKAERRNQFFEVVEDIEKMKSELYSSADYIPSKTVVDETDLSLRKLEELQKQLQALQKEKVWFFPYHSNPYI